MPINDPPLPSVFTRADAARAGLTRNQINLRAKNGHWRFLARGAYCLTADWERARPEARQIMAAEAAIRTVAYPAFVSHASAAALHDLPVPSRGPAWITRLPPGSTRYSDELSVEVATVPIKDQWTLRDLPVTSLRRTVADCMRHLSPPDALAVADAAQARVPSILEGVSRVLHDCSDWPYAGRAGVVLPLVDGRRESPLESWSFWFFHRFQVPLPQPQVDIYDVDGTFLGRADAWWDEYGVVGEADGRTKYDVVSSSLADVQEALYAEKRREDALRRAGAGVIRWGADDLRNPWRFADLVRRQLEAHPRHLFRGHAVPRPRVA